MAGRMFARGDGCGGSSRRGGSSLRGRYSLSRESEDGDGGCPIGLGRESEAGRGGRPVGLGGRSIGLGHESEDRRGGRPIGLGRESEDGRRGHPTGLASREGHGRRNEHGSHINSSSAPPPAAPRAPTTHTQSPTAVADNGSPESPATPAVGSSATPAVGTNLGDQVAAPSEIASSSNSKPLLKITHKFFTPSHVASGQITKCIKQRFDKEGYTWSAISLQTKEYYWNEFQKHFSFDRDLAVVRSIFERRAAMRYSGTLCEWRKSGKRPVNVPQETWDSWQQKWNTPEFKNKCLKASQNRLSEVAGPGNGPSTHSGGSRSAIDHSIHLEQVMARYNAATENQTDDGENSSVTVDLSTIYYEVAGPQKKQRVYGLGGKPSAAIFDCSSSQSVPLGRDQLRAELYEEMMHRQEEMEQQMRHRQEQLELELKQKQQEMENLIQRFMRGGGTSTPPTDPYPTDDDYPEDRDLEDE